VPAEAIAVFARPGTTAGSMIYGNAAKTRQARDKHSHFSKDSLPAGAGQRQRRDFD
jgi:hypothetical protein